MSRSGLDRTSRLSVPRGRINMSGEPAADSGARRTRGGNVSADENPRGWSWLYVVAIIAGVLLVVVMALVFLVLTGIIAEPETVIESIVRTLFVR